MSDESVVLAEVGALRRRTRATRHAYWLPVLYFGLAIVAAVPLYVAPADAPYELLPSVQNSRADSYWLAVLLLGALLSLWWYRRRGRRTGVEGRVDAAVVVAVVVVVAFLLWQVLPVGPLLYLPGGVFSLTPLLVIAVGLLTLARLERSRGLFVIAALYAAAAVLANVYDVENQLFRLGWDPFVAHPEQARYLALPNLLLPAVVLLVGGGIAGLRTALSRRAG